MGGKTKEETNIIIKKKVSASISAKISNFTSNVTSSAMSATLNVTNKLVTENTNSSSANSTATNILEDIVIFASDGSTVNIDQKSDAKMQMSTIVSILTDNTIKNKLAQDVSTQMDANIKNDTKLKASMAQAAKIVQRSDKAKGLANMVNSLTKMASDMVAKLTGSDSTTMSNKDIETTITTKMNTEIDSKTYNKSSASTALKNAISTSIKNTTKSSCLANALSQNKLDKFRAVIGGGSTVNVYQQANAKTFSKCSFSSKTGNAALAAMSTRSEFKSELKQFNKTQADLKLKQEAIIEEETKERAALADTLEEGIKTGGKLGGKLLDVILLPAMIVGGIIAVIIIFKLIKSMKSDDDDDDDDDDDNDDNNDNDDDQQGGLLDFNFKNITLTKRTLTLILGFIILDMVLKKTKSKK